MHDLKNFGDHLVEHREVWEYTDHPTKLIITADKEGGLHYSAFVAKPEHAASLDAALGKSFHQTTVDSYAARMADHLELKPTIHAVGDKGSTLTFKLPKDKGVVLTQEGIKHILGKGGYGFTKESITDAGYDWLQKEKRLIGSRHPFEQSSMAHVDALRQMPFAPLKETLKREHMVFPNEGKRSNANILLDHMESNPAFMSDLEGRLKKAQIDPQFRVSGVGKNGVFLETKQGVVVAIRGEMFRDPSFSDKTAVQVQRQPIPQHLHPLAQFKAGNADIEILPKLETDGLHYKDAMKVGESITATPHPDTSKVWEHRDPAGRNVGRSKQGTLYVLDGDSVVALEKNVAAGSVVGKNGAAGWISEKGTWKQYEEFKDLHEKFNSPLHQNGGKLSAANILQEAEGAAAKTSGKAKWIVGGIVAAAVVIGAVVALNKKKSFTEREDERRQNTNESVRAVR